MAIYNQFILTRYGEGVLTQLLGAESNLLLSQLRLSESIYSEEDIREVTELDEIKTVIPTTSVWFNEDTGNFEISGKFDNLGITEPFTINSVGLYAKMDGVPQLIGVSKAVQPLVVRPYVGTVNFYNLKVSLTLSQDKLKTIEIVDGNFATHQELSHLEASLGEKIDDVDAQLAHKAEQEEVNTVSGRIDNLVANAGNTDGNAELLDIRVGWDGVAYPTAGDAVRSIQQALGDMDGLYERIYPVSKNLFNPNQLTYGWRLNRNTGGLIESDNSFYTEYILVKGNASYTISKQGEPYSAVSYDSEYNRIEGYLIGGTWGDTTINTPMNTSYLRYSLPADIDYEKIMLSEGTEILPFEEYQDQGNHDKTVADVFNYLLDNPQENGGVDVEEVGGGVVVISSEQTKPIIAEISEALLEYDTGKVFVYDGTEWAEWIEWGELL